MKTHEQYTQQLEHLAETLVTEERYNKLAQSLGQLTLDSEWIG